MLIEEDVLKNFYNKNTSKKIVRDMVSKMIYDLTGLTPYQEQLKAGEELSKGNIVNQSTGEGKTISVLIAILMKLRENSKVFVVTSNDYLSERDYQYSKPLIEALGKKSEFLKQGEGGNNYTYGSSDVIYATGETLIFDYLRGVKADYDFAIIDEIDYILVECAGHDFSVSDKNSEVRMPKELFVMCKKLADMFKPGYKSAATKPEDILFDLNYENDYIVDNVSRSVYISKRGYETLEKMFGIETDNLMLIEALTATLLVKHFYLKDVNYAVRDGKIEIIDEASGRILPNGSNDVMIQTAMEVKEGLPVKNKAILTNTCAFPVFFKVFKDFSGISGTTSYVPYDFDFIYGKKTVKIKDHQKSQREDIYEFFENDEERINRILDIIASTEEPCLVVSDSDRRSQEMFDMMVNAPGKTVRILDNNNLSNEEAFLEGVKAKNAILISSKIVGRGTDIDLPPEFEEGLIVILTRRMLSERAERQVIGRTGRNGRKGKAYILTSKDDLIFDLKKKNKPIISNKDVKALQDSYEVKAFEGRKHIYIRSKLFFDQDKALKDFLEEELSFKDIYSTSQKATVPEKEKVLQWINSQEDKDALISEYMRKLASRAYREIRPYFQAQFLRYNDIMASDLYNNNFYYRSREYIQDGINIIVRCFEMALTLVETNNARLQKRERGIFETEKA